MADWDVVTSEPDKKADPWAVVSHGPGTIPGMENIGPLPPAGQRPAVPVGLRGQDPSQAPGAGTERFMWDLPKGIGQGALSTMYHGGDLIRRGLGMNQVINDPQVQAAITPTTPGTKVGSGLEQAAEYLAPGGLIGDAAKGVDALTASRLLRAGGHAGLEALSAGGVAGLQSGGDPTAMRNAALTAGGTSAALSAAGAAVPAIKRGITEVVGKTTGAGAQGPLTALSGDSPVFTQAMRNPDEMGTLGGFKDALQNVRDVRGSNYRQALSQIPATQTLDLTPLRQEMNDALNSHGVKLGTATAQNPSGLDFSRSTIRDAAAQNDVRGIVQDINGWGSQSGDTTPLGVDTLKRRIDDFWSPSSNARAFIQRLKSTTRDVLDQVPGYQDMTKDYATASQFLDQLKDLSLESKNPGTAIRKLTTTLNQNNDYRKMLVEALDQYSNQDLGKQLAGLSMSKWAPRGIMGPAGGIGLIAAIATGHLNPAAAAGLALSSPRIMGELLSGMSHLAPPISAAAKIAPRVAAAISARQPTQPAPDPNAPLQLTSPE